MTTKTDDDEKPPVQQANLEDGVKENAAPGQENKDDPNWQPPKTPAKKAPASSRSFLTGKLDDLQAGLSEVMTTLKGLSSSTETPKPATSAPPSSATETPNPSSQSEAPKAPAPVADPPAAEPAKAAPVSSKGRRWI